MKHTKRSNGEDPLVERVRIVEERLFSDQLHVEDKTRMKSDQYSWLYRPSHHIATGLITQSDIDLLSIPGKQLLSVGAHPAYFERVLSELGIPAENILIADTNPDVTAIETDIQTIHFDMLGEWSDIGTFDLIIFPESLCIALSDHIKKTGDHGGDRFGNDALEATLLSNVLQQALQRLHDGGEVRANGPQSHPNVVTQTRTQLDSAGYRYELEYQRYFLRVGKTG